LLTRPAGEDISTALRAALVELAESVVAPARDRHLLRHRILQENGDPRFEDHLGALAAKSTMLREVIAERLENVTKTIGDPHRVMAGSDCGFETIAGRGRVAEDVVWAKFRSMTAGAKLASSRLF